MTSGVSHAFCSCRSVVCFLRQWEIVANGLIRIVPFGYATIFICFYCIMRVVVFYVFPIRIRIALECLNFTAMVPGESLLGP